MRPTSVHTRSRRTAALLLALACVAVAAPRAEAQQKAALPETGGGAISIDWRVLAGLDYEKGISTDTLKKLDGKRVRVPGFVVPLDDGDEEGAEFLLVPYYGACVHTPPPPPNQMAFVQMTGKKAVKLALFDAVWMEGTLRITNYDSPYGQVGFTIEGLSMKPYTGK
jgi:uncharacterized protein